jgi:hypothetical protein
MNSRRLMMLFLKPDETLARISPALTLRRVGSPAHLQSGGAQRVPRRQRMAGGGRDLTQSRAWTRPKKLILSDCTTQNWVRFALSDAHPIYLRLHHENPLRIA